MTFPVEIFEDIVVIAQETEDTSPLGIILPGDSGKLPCGRVVACGPGRTYAAFADATGNTQFGYRVPTSVKVGDFVIFGKYQSGGEPMTVEGKKYLMCREGDLAGKTVNGQPIAIRRE